MDAATLYSLAMEFTHQLAQKVTTVDPIDATLAAVSQISMCSIMHFLRKPVIDDFLHQSEQSPIFMFRKSCNLDLLKLNPTVAKMCDNKRTSLPHSALTFSGSNCTIQFGKGPLLSFPISVPLSPFPGICLLERALSFDLITGKKHVQSQTSGFFGPAQIAAAPLTFGKKVHGPSLQTGLQFELSSDPIEFEHVTRANLTTLEPNPLNCLPPLKIDRSSHSAQVANPRRSVRIAAKKHCQVQSLPLKKKVKRHVTLPLPFDIMKTNSPLLPQEVVSIMESSGLSITKEVQNMIEEKIAEDESQSEYD